MNNFLDILKLHLNKYPLMQAEDVYKLAYQFYFGPGHFIDDKDKAYNYLLEEAKECHSLDIEIIDLGEYARINLINDKEYLSSLFKAFFNSAKINEKPIQGFINLLDTCSEYLIENNNLFNSFNTLKEKMKILKYPAISHSEIYRENYHPHYRLINKKHLGSFKNIQLS